MKGPVSARPFGVAELPEGRHAVVVDLGDAVFDLAAAGRCGILDSAVEPSVLAAASLNPLLEAGPAAWRALGAAVDALVDGGRVPEACLRRLEEVHLCCPVQVADYVDGYGGLYHATNLGRMLRPGSEPLLPNWRHLPVAYHGRAGTVTVSGSGVSRPTGPVLVAGEPVLQPTAMLDIELEVGYVIGVPSRPGNPVTTTAAADHVFGVVLVNDWSARDIQSFEYQPLGPYLAKSFATTMSAWVMPYEALRPSLVGGLAAEQEPEPAPSLRLGGPAALDLELEVLLQSQRMRSAGLPPAVVSRVRHAEAMYWSMPQQLAHATVNGASLRVGDLFASGTVSGPDPRSQGGSLMELTWGGTRPLVLPGGEERSFLEDGDRVVLRGWCHGPGGWVELGPVDDLVRAAHVPEDRASATSRRGGARALLPPGR